MLRNENENYCGVVVRVTNLIKLDKLDNQKGFPCFGEMAIVDNSTNVGDLGVLFTCGTKLSEKYCYENNLNTDSSKNKDQQKKGYVSSNRIRNLKLKGNLSTCLYLPLESLSSFCDIKKLKEGDSFTHINGHEICSKYIVKQQNQGQKSEAKPKKERVVIKTFPEHDSTDNFFKNKDKYHPEDDIICTVKLHGTSVRLGHSLHKRNLSFFERVLTKIGFNIQQYEYKKIAGSRKVIKYTKNPTSGYYKEDIYNQCLDVYQHLIPKNWVIFGEIIGWAGDRPIQPKYTYQIPRGCFDFYCYRISVLNEDGYRVDLTYDQVKDWCSFNNIKVVPEIWRGKFKDFNADMFMNKRYLEEYGIGLPLDSKDLVDEGIVIMKYGIKEYFSKAKSTIFLGYESDNQDMNISNLEDENS